MFSVRFFFSFLFSFFFFFFFLLLLEKGGHSAWALNKWDLLESTPKKYKQGYVVCFMLKLR